MDPKVAGVKCCSSLMLSLLLYLSSHFSSSSSRSPLVNWAAYELGIELTMGDLGQNPHPIGQIPCLVDNTHGEDLVIYESGAILLYLNSLLASDNPKGKHQRQAEIYSWVCWPMLPWIPFAFWKHEKRGTEALT